MIAFAAGIFASGATLAGTASLYPTEDCSKAVVQYDLNMCAGANDAAADKALNEAYKTLLARQPDRKSKARLRDAERAWIVHRDKECAGEVGPQEGGGSIWPMEMSNCLEQMTAARIRELTKLRGCAAGVSACNPH